jgi:kynurenine formamidase
VDGYAFHEILLGGDRLIAENLTRLDKLLKADPGGYWSVNMIPLKIEGVDGSPIRAFAHPQGMS